MTHERMQGPDFDIPTTFEQFETAYNKTDANDTAGLAQAMVSSIDLQGLQKNLDVATQMIRQHHRPHAKASSEPNPQNAPEAVAAKKGQGFSASAHPTLKDYLSAAVNDVVKENPQVAKELVTSFGKDRAADNKNFNKLVNKLQAKLRATPAPRPGRSTPRPDGPR